MQVPGFKIVLTTGAAIVLALAFGNIEPLTTFVGRADAVRQRIPTAAWFFAPLLLTTIVWIAERFGLIQPLFSTLYKDLTDSQIGSSKHLSDKDQLRLMQMLERWKAPMPHLARADRVLAFWGGKERWSFEGFDRCWKVALLYPLAVLVLVWVIWNNGQLGTATLIPAEDEAWRRWLLIPLFGVQIWLIWAGRRLSDQPDRLRQWLVVRSVPLLRRLSDVTLGAFASAVAVAAAVAVAVALAGTVAVTLVGAVAVALAVAVASALTFVDALALAIAVAIAVAVAVAGAGVVAVAIAIAGAGVVAVMTAILPLDDHAQQAERPQAWRPVAATVTLAITLLSIFVGAGAMLPMLPGWGIVLAKGALTSSGMSFVALVFLGLLPLLNAVSDWVSINATRAFIARMQAGASRGEVGRLYFYDFAIALALTLIVYAAALAVIWMMQRFGWQVDVKSVLVELRDNPWSGQSTWLLTLAVTNFIPTLVHVALWMFGSVQSRAADTRADIEQFLRDGGTTAPRQIAPTIVSMLRIQPWLERAMVLSLTLALIPLFAICVPWAADWLLQRL